MNESDVAMPMQVWAVLTVRQGRLPFSARETVEEARRIADESSATVLAVIVGDGTDTADSVRVAAYHGADDAAVLTSSGRVTSSALAEALIERITASAPLAVLFAGTARGVDLGARVGAIVNRRFGDHCVDVEIDDDSTVTVVRKVPGSNRHRRQRWSEGPALLSLMPGAYGCAAFEQSRPTPVAQLWPLESGPVRKEHSTSTTGEPREQELRDCDIVFGVGAGVGGADGVTLVRELADLLGAGVAASRPTVDAGWLPGTQKVGLTGQIINPSVYIACGISGASQHLFGVRSAGALIAINKDPSAPIVARADLAVIGDIGEIVPAVYRKVAERRKSLHDSGRIE